jgi:phosphopantothenoylcysteine decarboxylase / phosphopantothenate---cysteine ligase
MRTSCASRRQPPTSCARRAGRADDLLTAILLATTAPVLICPCDERPDVGASADDATLTISRPSVTRWSARPWGAWRTARARGPGRLEEPAAIIVQHIGRALEPARVRCTGRRVVVTAGPTREAVDPVRVLTNRSSGRMGYALAEACWRRGAEVTLVTGPTEIAAAAAVVGLVRVESVDEMAHAVRREIADADALVMAAAPADFRPATAAERKIKKDVAPNSLALVNTVDILESTRDARSAAMVAVGFALESHDGVANARAKLEAKELDLVVLNSVGETGAGFEVHTNRVTLIGRDGSEVELPLQAKAAVADEIIDRVAELVAAKAGAG